VFSGGSNQMSNSSYDGAGNQTGVNGFTVAYDAENRQVSVTEIPALGSGQEVYLYDAEGQRVREGWDGREHHLRV
jgi:hypothetical protein